MKFNKIRFYLFNLDSIQTEIKLLNERIKTYNEYNDINITVEIKECVKSSNSENSNVELSAVNRIENIDKLLLKISELHNLELAIRTTILYLSPKEKKVIEARYFNKQGEQNKFEYIARKFKYSERHIKFIETGVIKKISEKYIELTNY